MNPYIRIPIMALLAIPILIVVATQFILYNFVFGLYAVIENDTPEWIGVRETGKIIKDIFLGR